MSNESISKAVADCYAAIGVMDLEAWVNTFAEDAVIYDPVGTPPQEGHEAIFKLFSNILDLFESIKLTEDFVHIVGNEVAVKWTGYALGKNRREVRFAGIDIFELNETGKIKTLRSYWNATEAIAQLSA